MVDHAVKLNYPLYRLQLKMTLEAILFEWHLK
jgi:hypothetical protein